MESRSASCMWTCRPTGLPADALAARIRAELTEEIARHLSDDGLPPCKLGADGIAGQTPPPCASPREALLADAPTLSVVICTRNRPDSLRTTLRSILDCNYPAERLEVIVVDNASEGDAAVAHPEGEFGAEVAVRVVREPEPGLSNARNQGLGARPARSSSSPTTTSRSIATGWRLLVAPFARGERVGATSGMTLPGALETPAQRWVEGFGGRARGFDTRVFDLDDPPADQPLFPFTVGDLGAGRNMAFRRDLLIDREGSIRPSGPGTLAHDGDDIEALFRILLSGHQIVHDPAAIVWHAHPREYRELHQRVWGYGVGLTACLTKADRDPPSPSSRSDAQASTRRRLRAVTQVGEERREAARLSARRSSASSFAGWPTDRWPTRGAAGISAAVRRRTAAPPPRHGAAPRSSLRILMVTDEYRPYIGGAGRCIELFAKELSRLGHTVAIATAWHPDAPAHEFDGPVEVHRIRDLPSRMRWISEDPKRHTPPPFPDPEAVWRLRRLIKDFQPGPDPRLRVARPFRGRGADGKRIPLRHLGPRVRERLRNAHHGSRQGDLLGTRSGQVPGLLDLRSRSRQGHRGGGQRVRGAAAAAAQDDRDP